MRESNACWSCPARLARIAVSSTRRLIATSASRGVPGGTLIWIRLSAEDVERRPAVAGRRPLGREPLIDDILHRFDDRGFDVEESGCTGELDSPQDMRVVGG